MSITRTRLRPEESRARALEAAREILVEHGPRALTLKAVAGRIGRTHANLLHHFGSAGGLQKALAASIAEQLGAKIGLTVMRTRRGEADPKEIVELTFDAFAKEGAGALATWAMLSGEREALEPVMEAIQRVVDDLDEQEGKPLRANALSLMLAALGDALLGEPMTRALNLPRGTARELALRQLILLGGLDGEPQTQS
jgi:AcrR family transcriptional regulator